VILSREAPDSAAVTFDLEPEGIDGGIADERFCFRVGNQYPHRGDRTGSIATVDPGVDRIRYDQNVARSAGRLDLAGSDASGLVHVEMRKSTPRQEHVGFRGFETAVQQRCRR